MSSRNNKKNIILWGAGELGCAAMKFIGKEKIDFYIDSDRYKQEKGVCGIKVFSPAEGLARREGDTVIIATSEKFVREIEKQLKQNDVDNYETFKKYRFNKIKEKTLKRKDYIKIYQNAIKWVIDNTAPGKGIIKETKENSVSPEITGIFIPSLLRWGYKDLATQYSKWLCRIQCENGAWHDTEGNDLSIFGSSQILMGLIAIRILYPEVKRNIIKGCDWLLKKINVERESTDSSHDTIDDEWSRLKNVCCISVFNDAGIAFNIDDYSEAAKAMERYYIPIIKNNKKLLGEHPDYCAYIMEALLGIGEIDTVKDYMRHIESKQKESGAVLDYNDAKWINATDIFRWGIVWFRIGEYDRGRKAFMYACNLQNNSGGWFERYPLEYRNDDEMTHVHNDESCCAVKYFLDALYYKNLAQFELQSYRFWDDIDIQDGRYQCIRSVIDKTGSYGKVLDIGCGKGRYLKKLVKEYPDKNYYAVDLSLSVMDYFNINGVEKYQGNLTNIPFADNYFDIAYTCEALEHAVDIERAIRELCRVVKPDGTVAIIDKNIEKLGFFELEDWEQWFDENTLKTELMKYCSSVKVIKKINYDNENANGLFYCWIGKIKD